MEEYISSIDNFSVFNIFYYFYPDIIKWKLDSKKLEKQVEEIQEIVEVEEVEETEEIEIIEQEEIPQANPYWDYIKMNLIKVDFNELKKINTKGWIQVNGTNINLLFMQKTTNII